MTEYEMSHSNVSHTSVLFIWPNALLVFALFVNNGLIHKISLY